MKWYVYNMDNGGEVSVNYGNPKKHFDSYGWSGPEKIILGGTCDEEEIIEREQLGIHTEKEWKEVEKDNKKILDSYKKIEIKLLKKANLMCELFNKNKIKP